MYAWCSLGKLTCGPTSWKLKSPQREPWATPSSSASVMVDVNPPLWLSDVCGLSHFHSRILSMEIWWYVGIMMEFLVNLLHFDKTYGTIKSYIHVSEYMSCPHAVAYIHHKHVCYQVASRIPPLGAQDNVLWSFLNGQSWIFVVDLHSSMDLLLRLPTYTRPPQLSTGFRTSCSSFGLMP